MSWEGDGGGGSGSRRVGGVLGDRGRAVNEREGVSEGQSKAEIADVMLMDVLTFVPLG